MSTESTSNKYHIKKLDNNGLNYSTWAIHCQMVLKSLDLWDVVDPNVPTSTPPSLPSSSGKPPSSDPSIPANVKWNKKNKKVLTVIGLSVEDMPIHIVKGKRSARDAWKALAERYTSVSALDASMLMSRLHRFQLDDSKSLEIQLNQMHEMCTQLATLGDIITDAKFAMIISEALPSSYN